MSSPESELELRVRVLRPELVEAPRYHSARASGLDLCAAIKEPVVLPPGGVATIPTGIAIACPPGYEGQIRPRSGLAAKHGLTVLNGPGTIDGDYRGEVKVVLVQHGRAHLTIEPGDRIAQLVIAPVARVKVVEVDALDETERGSGGFGSTGRK